MHKYSVFIGRFEPLHLGHQSIIEDALKQSEKLIIVIGSHNKARSVKNPWSSDERREMIISSLTAEQLDRIKFICMNDYAYNESLWISALRNKISEITNYVEDESVALVGFKSDSSSYYLDLFPTWKFISCPTNYNINATKVRNMYFTHDIAYKKYVHPKVADYMESFKKTELFSLLKDEFRFLSNYRESWRGAPFDPTFVTVDAVVVRSGHVLLVRRGKSLGKGQLAIPGGFLEQGERIVDATVRELKEKTLINLSKNELKKHIVESKVFDDPSRSMRGRTISHAHLINLGSGPLDEVNANDTAKASWLPLNEVLSRESEFFEDHYQILSYFLHRI